MMIFLSTIEQGTSVLFQTNKPTAQENPKRLSRVPTLDGGCAFSYSGFSEADRTFLFECTSAEKDTCDELWLFYKEKSLVCLACEYGVFTGYISNLKILAGKISLTFLVYEKITQ